MWKKVDKHLMLFLCFVVVIAIAGPISETVMYNLEGDYTASPPFHDPIIPIVITLGNFFSIFAVLVIPHLIITLFFEKIFITSWVAYVGIGALEAFLFKIIDFQLFSFNGSYKNFSFLPEWSILIAGAFIGLLYYLMTLVWHNKHSVE